MPEPALSKLAVLIDADNASPRHATAIFEEIAGLGEANVRRIYGDFSNTRLSGWDDPIQQLAILQEQQRNNTVGKNAADIALVIDAMDLLHGGKLDGFCLVSSDSDFTRLAQRLREDGMLVYGFGERKTPESFRAACSRFIYVENLVEPEPAGETVTIATETPDRKEPVTKAVPIIRKAMAGIQDDDGWASMSGIGSRIPNIAADFDPRNYGLTKLSAVVEKTGAFETKVSGGALAARPKAARKK